MSELRKVRELVDKADDLYTLMVSYTDDYGRFENGGRIPVESMEAVYNALKRILWDQEMARAGEYGVVRNPSSTPLYDNGDIELYG